MSLLGHPGKIKGNLLMLWPWFFITSEGTLVNKQINIKDWRKKTLEFRVEDCGQEIWCWET